VGGLGYLRQVFWLVSPAEFAAALGDSPWYIQIQCNDPCCEFLASSLLLIDPRGISYRYIGYVIPALCVSFYGTYGSLLLLFI